MYTIIKVRDGNAFNFLNNRTVCLTSLIKGTKLRGDFLANKISEQKVTCPICGNKEAVELRTEKKIPYVGPIDIITLKCNKCGYKKNDVIIHQIRDPVRYKVVISNEEDLNIRVFKSSSGTIKIPEFGFEMSPGPVAQSFITNVEGVLNRVLDAIFMLEALNPDANKEKVNELKQKLEKARMGKLKFTVIIEDPFGNSIIVSKNPNKVRKEKMDM